MRRHSIAALTLTIVLASAAAVAARAQDAPRGRSHRSGTVIISDGAHTDTMHLGERHGRLGITVDMRPDASRDSIGARVAGITTPNSPAAAAGVQVGDIVTRFNGTPLAVSDGRGGDEEQSRPAMRLINLASRLDAGDTVRLDLRRGTQNVSVTLVAGESDVDDMMTHMRMPGMMELGPLHLDVPGEPGGPGGMMRTFVFGGPMSDLELVRVNPGLGEYFGTQEGLLVVSVGGDTALGLRAGDVILTIGGRKAASPPQAMRILGTYEPDETVAFDVMRQHRRASVSGKIPQRREPVWSIRRNNLEFNFSPEMRRLLERGLPNIELMMPELKMRHAPHDLIRITGEV